jgi:glycine/D-amino acid oxidase-like deaminating enzyme
VICGAGIAGISSAYFLAAREGIKDILLLDMDSPLSLTSDQSTECYRNWWPGPGDGMVRLMNCSIDLMEGLARDSNNIFHLNRRVLYCSSDPARVPAILQEAQEISRLGAGPWGTRKTAVTNLTPCLEARRTLSSLWSRPAARSRSDPALLPVPGGRYLCCLTHCRAGWLSAQQLGCTC